jgi:MSHA biogenesis protein MshJ
VRLRAYTRLLARRFDRLSLRERVLVMVAVIAVLVGAFDVLLLKRLDARRAQLSHELADLQAGMDQTSKAALASAASDPVQAALTRSASLKSQLATVDAELASRSAGMIAPRRMTEAVHDVLSRQHGLTLISLHNLAAIALPDARIAVPAGTPRPYLHTVEIVLQGRYLDVLAYLRALEALPWRFYWRRLELASTRYPTNEVHIELGTISMDSEWIGL